MAIIPIREGYSVEVKSTVLIKHIVNTTFDVPTKLRGRLPKVTETV